METKGLFDKVVSGTKKFGSAAKKAGTSVKNNIGKSMSKVAETTKDIVGQSGEIGVFKLFKDWVMQWVMWITPQWLLQITLQDFQSELV